MRRETSEIPFQIDVFEIPSSHIYGGRGIYLKNEADFGFD